MKLIPATICAALLAVCAANTASSQETRLTFATVTPPPSPLAAQVLRPWAERVNEQGKGVLALDVREGFAIANYENIYSRVLDDVIQIGLGLHAQIGGQFPKSDVAGLPFVSESAEAASVALWRVYKAGLMADEYRDVVPIMVSAMAQFSVHLSKAPASLDSLKGMKIMAGGKLQSDIAAALGATPLSISITNGYEAMQRGTIDGMLVAWTAFPSFKLNEVTNYHIDTNISSSTAMVFMSKKKFDSLPAPVRRIIEANATEAESRAFGAQWDRQNAGSRIKDDPKHTVVQLTPEQQKKWQQAIQPAVDDWKRRANGEAVLEAFRAEIANIKSGK
jgi:TRAP-type transport system periplasmic protein